jgi:FixJ family two-component response regulator
MEAHCDQPCADSQVGFGHDFRFSFLAFERINVSSEPLVVIVDDPEFSESLSVLINSMGWKTKCHSSPEEYLQNADLSVPGCLILDVRMPNTSGLALQEQLAKLPNAPSIVIMTGHAEVPTALRAMRLGAVDFLQKTFSEDELYDAIQRAMAQDTKNRAERRRNQELADRFGLLSAAEKDVLEHILKGAPNKSIAAALGISRRTVEDRRARLMQKLEVDSLADLVRLAIEAGMHPKCDS